MRMIPMPDSDNLIDRIETLERQVQKLEGVIQVTLQELENGSIEDSAARILDVLEQDNDKPEYLDEEEYD